MKQPKRYSRSNSTMPISIFHEYDMLNKFNYSPSYQRDDNIWDIKSQSFLIDTIFKNFPMPPIFLEQKIKNGITSYDVIDGKQRLTTIKKFINNEIPLPQSFSADEYGYSKLDGKYFSEIEALTQEDSIAGEFLDTFWSYKLGVEYIEKPDDDIVRNIFDRLNRNGSRLNPAELRKSRFGETLIYKAISEISKTLEANSILNKSNDRRQRCINFWTEVFVFAFEDKICSGDAHYLETKMEEMSVMNSDQVATLQTLVSEIIQLFLKWNIDIDKYDIAKETHLYVLLYLSFKTSLHDTLDFKQVGDKVNNFYQTLRTAKGVFPDDNMKIYYDSTQSGSKSSKSRKVRFNALVRSIGLNELIEK